MVGETSKLPGHPEKIWFKTLPSRMKMNVVKLKKCTKCFELKDTDLFINKCGMCKTCRSIHRKEYREKNIEKFKEKDKKYHEKHKEKVKIKVGEYYVKNKDKIMEQRKICRDKNRDENKKRHREYYHANLNRRLSLVYRNRVRREIKTGKNHLEYLGCSIEDLKRWFEFNFELDGFSWDDYNILWEIDHVIPCAKFNMEVKYDIYKCFNWRNTKPESKSFNKKKSSNIIDKQVFILELRLFIFEAKLKPYQKLVTAA